MILFFDTETIGLPKDWKAPISDLNNWPRLVQLAYVEYDNYGNKISDRDFIIKPNGFTIPIGVSQLHGISTEKANREGKDLKLILLEFDLLIKKADYVVAHNMSFDEMIVGAEFLRTNLPNAFSGKKKICTKESSTNYCAIDGPYGYKWPKLSELYYKLFNTDFDEAHNAYIDIAAITKCFWELIRIGEINLKDVSYHPIGDQLAKDEEKYAPKAAVSTLDLLNAFDAWQKKQDAQEDEKVKKAMLKLDTTTSLIPYRKKSKWGFCTVDKKIAIECVYDNVGRFIDGIAIVQLNKNWSYIDYQGNEVIPLLNKSKSLELDWKWGYIDKTGKQVIPYIYDTIFSFSEGLAGVKLNDKYGFIDEKGNQVVPHIYDYVGRFKEGLARVNIGGEWDFDQEDYDWDIEDDERYNKWILHFDDDFKGGQWGYIDKTGKVVIPLIFDVASDFKDGLAIVETECGVENINMGIGGSYYIDRNGKQVIIPFFNDGFPSRFSEGLAINNIEDKYGFVNILGEQLVPCIYNDVEDFSNGLAKVLFDYDIRGYIDKNGTQYWED